MDFNNSLDDNNHSFSDLCDDVLIVISSYLPIIDKISLSRVSLRFNAFIDQSLKSVSVIDRKTLFGTKRQPIIAKTLMAAVIEKCCNAKHISLRDIRFAADYDINDVIMKTIADYCHHLQTIDFDRIDVNCDYFKDIVEHCPCIRSVASKTINDEWLTNIIESPTLESLDVSENPNITGHEFKIIGPNIKEINLNNTLIDTSKAIERLSCGNGLMIEKLTVYVPNPYMFRSICDNFQKLNHLNLNIAREYLNYFPETLSKLPHLTSLALNEGFFNNLCSYSHGLIGPRIRKFEITCEFSSSVKTTDGSLSHIEWYFPLLEKLVLRHFDAITDSGVGVIANLKYLKHVDLMDCGNIGNNGVADIISKCSSLRVLNVHNCKRVSHQVLDKFVDKCLQSIAEQFVLDVINTNVNRDEINRRKLAPNLTLLVNIEDCNYRCIHFN